MIFTDLAFEINVGLVTIISTAIGIWVAMKFSNPKAGHTKSEKIGDLTPREYEVLQLLMQGFSNAEIADKLFLSLSTVKTHVSTLFVKLGVKSRTQAVEKANRLRITPPGSVIL